jgi:aspartate kinase
MKVVMKFGGTSLKNERRIKHVANLISKYGKDELVIVCSAVDGVTDQLEDLTDHAKRGAGVVEEKLERLKKLHQLLAAEVAKDRSIRKKALEYVNSTLTQLERSIRGVAVLKELSARSKDLILSCGERLSTPIVWGALKEQGIDAVYLTGAECGIITNNNFGDAAPLMEVTKFQVNEILSPILQQNKVPVVTGYIGATQDGETTTLGRGGSDFTATIIAASIKADEVWIWSDVDGLMTADPRLVPEARVLSEVSYAEAGEMAVFGAKALHPRTLEPVAEAGILVRFRNTFNPEHRGTLVNAKANVDSKRVVKSVALIEKVAIITISGASMVGKPGSAAKIFDVVAKSGANILMISQSVSESNISMVVKRSAAQKAVNALEIALLGAGGLRHVMTEDDVSAIAVIGGGMRGIPGIASRVFGAVASRGINVRMIAQGSSEQNISFVVDEKDGKDTIRVIHSVFGLGKAHRSESK